MNFVHGKACVIVTHLQHELVETLEEPSAAESGLNTRRYFLSG